MAMPNALEFQMSGSHGRGCGSAGLLDRITNAVLGMKLSTPGGLKPTYLKDHGHEVINPALGDNDFDTALRSGGDAEDRCGGK